MKALLPQVLELSERQQQFQEQRPALGARPTQAERQAYAQWKTVVDEMARDAARLDAEVAVELARWKAQQGTDRQPGKSPTLPGAGS